MTVVFRSQLVRHFMAACFKKLQPSWRQQICLYVVLPSLESQVFIYLYKSNNGLRRILVQCSCKGILLPYFIFHVHNCHCQSLFEVGRSVSMVGRVYSKFNGAYVCITEQGRLKETAFQMKRMLRGKNNWLQTLLKILIIFLKNFKVRGLSKKISFF